MISENKDIFALPVNKEATIVIIGAGPAGLAASIQLSKQRIHHFVLDKAVFPRDKICGDALSGKVVQAIKGLNEQWLSDLSMSEDFIGSYGVRFVAPNGIPLDIPFKTNLDDLKQPPGFIAKRFDFDYWLFQKAQSPYATILSGAKVDSLTREDTYVRVVFTVDGNAQSLTSKLIIGAEGDRSIVAKSFSEIKKENDHYCAGIRAYYTGVTGLHEKNFIELHFIDELLPGYLWIFPMANGGANVGVGMLSSVISKKKINLRGVMDHIIKHHPEISKRFKHAALSDEMRGWGLPLGSKKRKISGDNFLLAGDAASLIDPFTGEGIGNAMISGIIAGRKVATAIEAGRLDGVFLKGYDEEVYRQLWDELKLSRTMQQLTRYPWLFNFVVSKASKNKLLQETITGMFEDMELRSRLKKPGFYFQLLFK